jgi:hypothetical protein
MAAFCAILLTQERKIDAVGWYPDRDNITIAYDRIAEWMFSVNFSAFRQRHRIDERGTKTLIGRPEPDAVNPRQSWYDELIRIPDFIAGPLAAWDYRNNLVPVRRKYAEILQGIVADNPYVMNLLLVDTAEGIGIGQLNARAGLLRASRSSPRPLGIVPSGLGVLEERRRIGLYLCLRLLEGRVDPAHALDHRIEPFTRS